MSDFDNDGFDDLAIGVRGESVGTVALAGAASVIFGSLSGLAAAGNRLWHQNVAGVAGVAECGDGFGNALASGDFDNDGFDDLAIGAPGEDVGAAANAGAINLLFGSAAGLTAAGNQVWHQDSAGVVRRRRDRRPLRQRPGGRRLRQRRLRRPRGRRPRRGHRQRSRTPGRSTCSSARRPASPRPATRSGTRTSPTLPTARKAATASAMPWRSATSTTTASTTSRSA